MIGHVFVDGGSRGNPGPSACAYVLMGDDERLLETGSKFLDFKTTNNCAEYWGIIYGLQAAHRNNIRVLHVIGDSEVVIKQMRGEYQVKDPNLQTLHRTATSWAEMFESVEYVFVRREHNQHADRLVNECLDANL